MKEFFGESNETNRVQYLLFPLMQVMTIRKDLNGSFKTYRSIFPLMPNLFEAISTNYAAKFEIIMEIAKKSPSKAKVESQRV